MSEQAPAGAENGAAPDTLAAALRHAVPQVLRALQGTTVEELRFERGGQAIVVRRQVEDAPPAAAEPAAAPSLALTRMASPGRTEVRAQVVGVFHRSQTDGAPPLAQDGDQVESGRRIGVVETLGLSSDVLAPVRGRLDEWAVQDGQAVEYNQLIAVILPD